MIAPVNPDTRLPRGYRLMTHDEAVALAFDTPVLLYDRDAHSTMRARVLTTPHHGEWMEVKTVHGGAIIRLELVDEDGLACCAEDEDGNIAAMVDEEAEQTIVRLAEMVYRIANTVQSQPTRDDYDALVLENAHLRDQLRSLALRVERMESAGRIAA